MYAQISAIVLHREGEIFDFVELVNGDNACRGVDDVGNAVYDGCAGVLNGSGFHNVELGIGLAGDLPVAHIAVVRSINFADALSLNNRTLEGLGGNYCGHADAVTFRDSLAESCGIEVFIVEVRNAFLSVGFDSPAHFGSKGLVGAPYIGGLENFGMSNVSLKFFGGEANTMSFCKSKAILLYVIADGALNFLDGVAAACYHADHVDPEDILHAAADEGAVVLFCDDVKAIGSLRVGGPAAGGFFTGGDYVDTSAEAFLKVVIAVAYKAEEGDNSDIRIAVIKHFVSVILDDYAGFYSKSCIVADVHADDCGVGVDSADDLCAVFIEVAENVLGHFAAAVLYYFYFFHNKFLPNFLCLS